VFRFFSAGLLALAAFGFAGCASVSSTAQFYFPTTTDTRAPKPKDWPVPILGRAPDKPYRVIGRLAFQSDLGWKFLRESMLYNARANGADAVILKNSSTKERVNYSEVPPRVDWVSMPGPVVAVNNGGGKKGCGGGTSYVAYPYYMPIYQPGYVRRWVQTITAIDSEMIVLRH